MPRKAIDYSKCLIYKIVCNDLSITDLYVGHTTDFSVRKNKHKSVCNNKKNKSYNLKIYQTIREHGGWENWSMILVEYFPCDNDLQAPHILPEGQLKLLMFAFQYLPKLTLC